MAHKLSCSAACGIFPDQGSNPCPLHGQADSYPLHHQGSPQPAILLYDQARPIPRQLHQAVPRVSPKPVDWNKTQVYTQKSDETVHDYYNQLQVIFKENSGLPLDVDSTQVVFNSMFINGLN